MRYLGIMVMFFNPIVGVLMLGLDGIQALLHRNNELTAEAHFANARMYEKLARELAAQPTDEAREVIEVDARAV